MYYEAIGPRRYKFNAIIHFCGLYFYQSDTNSQRYKLLRVKHIGKLLKITTFILLMMFIGYGIAFIAPLYQCLYKHKRITPLAINLPLLEKDSDLEYTLNMTLQMTMAFYSLCGSFATEVASCTIIHAVMLVPDLIRFNLMEFQKELGASGCGWKSFAHLRNTFIQLQDYERFGLKFVEF